MLNNPEEIWKEIPQSNYYTWHSELHVNMDFKYIVRF